VLALVSTYTYIILQIAQNSQEPSLSELVVFGRWQCHYVAVKILARHQAFMQFSEPVEQPSVMAMFAEFDIGYIQLN
jgi:hypothetical protein